MKLNLNDIIDCPGNSLSFDYEAEFSDLEINFAKPFVHPIKISGNVSNVAGVLHLKAECKSVVKFQCDRCAEEAENDYYLVVEAVLAERLESPDDIGNSEIILIENATVDIDEAVRSAIILESDMQLLCDEDCLGLCPTCGKNLNEGPCDCKPEIDPRLEKLKSLLE